MFAAIIFILIVGLVLRLAIGIVRAVVVTGLLLILAVMLLGGVTVAAALSAIGHFL